MVPENLANQVSQLRPLEGSGSLVSGRSRAGSKTREVAIPMGVFKNWVTYFLAFS